MYHLEGGSSFAIQFDNFGFLGGGFPAEWWRIRDIATNRTGGKEVVCRGVQLGCQIQDVYLVIGDDQRIDLQIGKVPLDINIVELLHEFGRAT